MTGVAPSVLPLSLCKQLAGRRGLGVSTCVARNEQSMHALALEAGSGVLLGVSSGFLNEVAEDILITKESVPIRGTLDLKLGFW